MVLKFGKNDQQVERMSVLCSWLHNYNCSICVCVCSLDHLKSLVNGGRIQLLFRYFLQFATQLQLFKSILLQFATLLHYYTTYTTLLHNNNKYNGVMCV